MRNIILMFILSISFMAYSYGVKGMKHGVRKDSLNFLSGLSIEGILLMIGIAVVVFSIYGIYYLYRSNKNEKEQKILKQKALRDYNYWAKCAKAYNKLNTSSCQQKVPELIANKNEYIFGYVDATLCELRSVRNSNYGGFSFRICKGISYHTGGIQGEFHDELREISSGKLIITNNRIVFIGTGTKREIKIEKISSLDNGWNYIEIGSESRQKSMIFANINGYIYRDMINTIVTNRNNGFRGTDFLDVWKR